jgi:hypothetical protein
LQGAGYQGSLLRDHHAEARREGERSILGTAKEFPYFWASCDWCGKEAYLDDEGETAPYLKFEKLLNWAAYKPIPDNPPLFCSRVCRFKYIDYYDKGHP